MMKTISIDAKDISTWELFHSTFSQKFGFPDYYGRNMNAWIDCMDEKTEEMVLLELGDCRELKESQPQIVEALMSCAAFINFRRTEEGSDPGLIISMYV